jgi:O-succinylbenzoic acid--CoA ligase
LLGGGPTPPALLARCAAAGAPVSLTWGMTEAASQICTRWPGDLEERPDCGPPLAFARVEEGGARGALIVRGPLVGGVLETRDGGRVDAQGRVEIEGRVDDVILSGGENIAPSEIERVLEAHPAVLEAAVVGVPDPVWGERPVAALVCAPGEARPGLEALRAWCRASLAPFMAPDQVRWTEALPRVALGKLSRAAVRAWWAQQTEGER